MNKTARPNYKAIRAELEFPTVLSHYNIEVEGSWPQVKIICPFHDDHTASCSINSDKHIFQCWSCQTTGNALEFVTLMEGFEPDPKTGLKDGALVALDIMGLSLDDYQLGAKPPRTSTTTNTKPVRAKGAPKNKVAAKKPVETTTPEEPEVLENKPLDFKLELDQEHPFFETRNLSAEDIQHFGLGYCKKGIMAGRICIPLHNEKGELVAYAGRYAQDELPDDKPRYKMPKGFHKNLVLYNLHRLINQGNKHVVLVEGYWSVMRLRRENIPAVACLGTTLSDQHTELLKQAGFQFITIIFDGDEGGRKGASSAVEKLHPHMYVRSIDLPDGIKPDTMSNQIFDRLRPKQ